MRALLLLLLAAAARAQLTTPPPSVTQLHDSFLEAVDEQRKAELVEAISTTAPASNRDIQALFDLFMRYPDERVRRGVLASLQLTNPRSPSLEDQFLRYLSEPEPDAVMFGIKGSLRIKAPAALPIITKLARKPFAFRSPHDTPLLSDKNAWWVQYQALEALAQWEGEAALPLLRQ